MKNKSFLFGIMVAFSFIFPLWIVDYFVFNSVMNTLIPVSIIFGAVVALRHTESISWFRRLVALALIGGAIYLALPTYTFSEAQDAIKQEIPEVVTLSKLDNSPLENDTFNPFSPKLFYTFRVTKPNGSDYILMFNPMSGKSFK